MATVELESHSADEQDDGPVWLKPADAEIAADVVERDIDWLIENRIPRSLITLIAGRPGQGKSLLTAWLAARVSREAGPVIFSNLEDLRAQTSRPRLRLAGADLDNVHFWTPNLTTPQGVDQLEAFVEALGIVLLVIDPVTAHFPRGAKDDREVLSRVAAMCERTGLAVVAIDHVRKRTPAGAHPLEAILGNGSGFQAAARFVYVFGPNPKDPDERVLAGAKTNIAEVGSMAFAFDLVEVDLGGKVAERPRLTLVDDESDVNAATVLSYKGEAADVEANPVKKAIAAEWLTSFLMFGQRPQKDVEDGAAKCGLSWATIRRAAKEIGIVKGRHGFGQGSYAVWELPGDHPALVIGAAAAGAVQAAAPDGDLGDGQLTVEQVLAMIDAGKKGGSNGGA